MADYGKLVEESRDAFNQRDPEAWVFEPRGEKLQRGWAYTSHVEAERAANA